MYFRILFLSAAYVLPCRPASPLSPFKPLRPAAKEKKRGKIIFNCILTIEYLR
jgi:hypothetical protein